MGMKMDAFDFNFETNLETTRNEEANVSTSRGGADRSQGSSLQLPQVLSEVIKSLEWLQLFLPLGHTARMPALLASLEAESAFGFMLAHVQGVQTMNSRQRLDSIGPLKCPNGEEKIT